MRTVPQGMESIVSARGPHCRPFIPLPQKFFFNSDVNGLHETKDYVSRGGVILCFEVVVVTREEFLLKFAALRQARKLT